MKKITFLLLMFCVTTCVMAQHVRKDFQERLFQARLAEVCLRLDLTDEVKEKFAPVYEQYCLALQSLRPTPMKQNPSEMKKPSVGGMKKGLGMAHPKGDKDLPSKGQHGMTDAQKVKNIKNKMEAQHHAQEIRLAYMEKFSAILTDSQLIKFYEVEEDIQRKLHERAAKGERPAPAH